MRIAPWTPARRCRHGLHVSRRGIFATAVLLQLAGSAGGTGSVGTSGSNVSAAAGHAAQKLAEADGSVDDRALIVDDADIVQEECPQSDVPKTYTIDGEYWTWRSTFTMATGDQVIGSLVRDSFSPTSGITLFDNASRLWAAVAHSGDTLLFSDCNGRRIATLKTASPGSFFGAPPEFLVATANQEVVGKTAVSDAPGKGVEVTVQDKGGNIFARMGWDSPWTVPQTRVVVQDPAYPGERLEIDQRTDPRVLSLLAASRFGSPSDALWIAGPMVELALAAILLLLCCGGCFACVRCCRSSEPRNGNGNRGATFFQRVFGEEEDSEDEPGYCRKGNMLFCCGAKSPAKGYGYRNHAPGEPGPGAGFF